MNEEDALRILEQHITIDGSNRCICGWQADVRFPLAQYAAHRKHLAEMLAKRV